MAKSLGTVVLIDDEPYAMKYYTMGLELEGFEVVELATADKAYEFFEEPHPEVRVVVLDIMMPPGEHLADEDHQQGLRTGIFIYSRILEQEALLAIRHRPLPVAVLTNVSNPTTLELLARVQQERGPGTPLRVWAKMDVSPMAFGDQLARWLKELDAAAQ